MLRYARLTAQVLILTSVGLCNQIVTVSDQIRGVILRQVWYIKTVRIVINSWSN